MGGAILLHHDSNQGTRAALCTALSETFTDDRESSPVLALPPPPLVTHTTCTVSLLSSKLRVVGKEERVEKEEDAKDFPLGMNWKIELNSTNE